MGLYSGGLIFGLRFFFFGGRICLILGKGLNFGIFAVFKMKQNVIELWKHVFKSGRLDAAEESFGLCFHSFSLSVKRPLELP